MGENTAAEEGPISDLLGCEFARVAFRVLRHKLFARDGALDFTGRDFLALGDAVRENHNVPAMEEIQNAVLDGPVGSTQFMDSIAQKIGCGTSQFVSGSGKQPHIVQAFRPGLRGEVIEPVYQRNAPICLAENEDFRRRHVFLYSLFAYLRTMSNYFFRLATTLTFRVCEIPPGVSASLIISACSCWCRFPDPVAGLALSDRPTYRTSRRVSSSRGWMYSRRTSHGPIFRGSSCAHTTSADGLYRARRSRAWSAANG